MCGFIKTWKIAVRLKIVCIGSRDACAVRSTDGGSTATEQLQPVRLMEQPKQETPSATNAEGNQG